MLRRPPSYSDSFLVLPGTPGPAGLTPLVIPEPAPAEPLPVASTAARWPQRITIFVFKGGLHVLFISAFETAFYFLYVNRSENQGILNTINTYYDPFINQCGVGWGNLTKWLVYEILTHEVNVTAVDAAGEAALAQRTGYNHSLLIWSSMYSVICFAVCCLCYGVTRWRQWDVPWGRIFLENGLFIVLLGLYEIFFFRTIIYNYDTISTPELNQYLVDGLAMCANL